MSSPPISRGFRGRGPSGNSTRIPPGQHLVTDFPVLSAGQTPEAHLPSWSFTLADGESPLGEWTWEQFNALPQTDLTVDIHCVTTWSKLDTHWRGVSIDTLLEALGLSEPPGPFTLLHCDGGYTTNVPSEDLLDGKAVVATQFDGEPLDPEHGGPARLLVPHLYFWKSAKWISGLQFTEKDTAGFWELRGYHIYGDPWREQRFTND